ncbi:MAG: preprotein translocase subunit SecE [Nitrospinota bacterium]
MRIVEARDQIRLFLREVRTEVRKVTWPPRRDTVASTGAVLVVVFLIALFLGFVDLGLSRLVGGLLRR